MITVPKGNTKQRKEVNIMKNTITTYEVWYKENQFGTNHLWGIYTDKNEAEYAVAKAICEGYKPTMWEIEK